MKVFVYSPDKCYTFGTILIAANSREEADRIALSANVIPNSFDTEIEGVYAIGEPRILHDSSSEL